MTTQSSSNIRTARSYLNCPRCGLTIELRVPSLAIRHCPRCVARSHTVVDLYGSGLPATTLEAGTVRKGNIATGGTGTSRESLRLDRMFSGAPKRVGSAEPGEASGADQRRDGLQSTR